MAGRRNRRASSADRKRAAAADLSFARLAADVVELDVGNGEVEERIATALQQVRAALKLQSASELARYTGLAPALDRARRELGVGDAASLVDYLTREPSMAALIEWMRLTDEVVPHGLGVPALASLLIAPQRVVEIGEMTVLIGMFCVRGSADERCVVLARWRVVRGDSFTAAALEGVDEPGGDDVAIAGLLTELAYESASRARQPRARAVVVVGSAKVGILGDLDDVRRRLEAVGAVSDVAVELIAVLEERNVTGVDEALTARGFDILVLWVEPAAQWAWNRARDFQARGVTLVNVNAIDVDGAIVEIADAFRDIVGGPDANGDEEDDLQSNLSDDERAEVRDALAAAPVKIVFVGGNETQAQYQGRVESDLEDLYGEGITIRWFPGWGSSWNATDRAAKGQMADANAVVVMTMIRTLLGASIRRRAGELDLPWIPCDNTGRQSLVSALEQALLVVTRSRAGA